MANFTWQLAAFLVVTLLIDLYLVLRPSIIHETSGRLMAFLGLLIFPGIALYLGLWQHVEYSKETSYCLSCHAMQTHGQSLLVDDPEFVPAAHYQNARVPGNEACYTCHTDYSFFGSINSKVRGFRNLLTQYFGTVPDTLRVAEPYQNRECLHCHYDTRSFLEASPHQGKPRYDSLMSGTLSCVSSGCHDVLHNRGFLEGLTLISGDTLKPLQLPLH